MAKRATNYRIYYWSRAGRPSSLGRAYSYSLFYGKIKLQSKDKFPVRKKSDREEYLSLLLLEYERLRKRALQNRRRKELARRKRDPLKFEKILRRKRVGPTEVLTYWETYSPDYNKLWIDKTISSVNFKADFKIRILDFTLTEPVIVESHDDIDAVALYLEELFYPHMYKFFRQHKKHSLNRYLLRIKYHHVIDDRRGGTYTAFTGVGTPREHLQNDNEFDVSTDILFHDVFSGNAESYITRNFNRELEIHGFSMEVMLRQL